MATKITLPQCLNIHLIHCEFGYWMDTGEFTDDPYKATIYMDRELAQFSAEDTEVITGCNAVIVTIKLMPVDYEKTPFRKKMQKKVEPIPGFELDLPQHLIN